MNASTRYATATGIYDYQDFEGPPPMPFDEVVNRKEYDRLRAINQELVGEIVKAVFFLEREDDRIAWEILTNILSLTDPTKTP